MIAALAGFLGGIAPQALFSSRTVHAQAFVQNAPPPPPIRRPGKHMAAREVAAQRFLLVDSAGHVFGVIGMNRDQPEIDLYDSNGNVIWRAPGHFGVTPTSQ
ncbi:MAG: hypothetical protein ACREHD_21425 [Pirellulales bacterium]